MPVTHDRHFDVLRNGSDTYQREILDTETAGADFKSVATTFIPGLFQTREYALTRLTEAHARLGLPDTIEATVNLRMRRAKALDDTSKRFHALLWEPVLYGATADFDVMVAQLEHLFVLAAKPNVKIGILPSRRRLTDASMTHIDIVDGKVTIETLATTSHYTDCPEVDMYLHQFDLLHAQAEYGPAAASLIRAAANALKRE